jgi:S1-C subfamily serine protease
MKSHRLLTRSAAAAALVLPLTVAAVGAPASASVALADQRGYPPPGWGYAAPVQSTSYAALDTSDATAAQSTGIVQISTVLDYGQGEAAGTGLVLESDGLVVTNHHVVEGATSITVTVPTTGATYDADVLGYDTAKDVAVLQLEDASGLATVTTDDAGVAVGDAVTAVGDAGGDGGSLTAAPGAVTHRRTSITVQDDLTGEERRLRNLVEVTSDVVPGDSGGALLDADGEVVGMSVAASSGSTSETVDGYAIPIARVLRVVARVEDGTLADAGTAFLGVQLARGSVTVAGVVDASPAQQLGLAAGDTVTSVAGTATPTAEALSAAVQAHEPGDAVAVTWTDGTGAAHEGTVSLASGPVG